MSSKSHSPLLAYFFLLPPFGLLGFHRFFLNYRISGFLYLTTLGFCGLGCLFDVFYIKKLIENQKKQKIGDVSYNMAWLFFALFGFFGLHKLYMSRALMFVLYFSTLGFFGIGLIYDLFTLNSQIDDSNRIYPLDFVQNND
jgi:TM2 domain-containing membrane protein YozV